MHNIYITIYCLHFSCWPQIPPEPSSWTRFLSLPWPALLLVVPGFLFLYFESVPVTKLSGEGPFPAPGLARSKWGPFHSSPSFSRCLIFTTLQTQEQLLFILNWSYSTALFVMRKQKSVFCQLGTLMQTSEKREYTEQRQ